MMIQHQQHLLLVVISGFGINRDMSNQRSNKSIFHIPTEPH